MYIWKVMSHFFPALPGWYMIHLRMTNAFFWLVTEPRGWSLFILGSTLWPRTFFCRSAVFFYWFDCRSVSHIELPILSNSTRHQSIPSSTQPHFKFWLCHPNYSYFRLDVTHKFNKHTLSSLNWLCQPELITFVSLGWLNFANGYDLRWKKVRSF